MRRQSKLHAKEQLEKEKLGEKKVAVDPPRKKRRVWKFPSQMKAFEKENWPTDLHVQSLLRVQHINGLQCTLLSENNACF